MDRRQAAVLLGVDVEATPDQVTSAWRRRATEHHPDRGGDPERFQRLVEARDLLLANPVTTGSDTPVRVVRRSLLTRLLDSLIGLVPRSWLSGHRRGGSGRDLE